jgi:GDPmannose 4,6-dehydratase
MDRYLRHASDFDRPTDINVSVADTKKTEKELGWKAKFFMKDVVRMMVEAELSRTN